MPDETPIIRFRDLPEQLARFAQDREYLLDGKPIDPEGERKLMTRRDNDRG